MGVNQIRSGRADVVLVGGAERMTNLSTADGTAALAAAAPNRPRAVRSGVLPNGVIPTPAIRTWLTIPSPR